MSVLLKKILWYKVDDVDNPINITDSLNEDLGRGIDIKNNVVVITLKNPPQIFNTDGTIKNKYVNSDGVIEFEEQDQFKVYLKYTDDMADVEDSVWDNNTEEPTTDNLKGVYYLIDFSVENTNNSNTIKIKCADKTYVLFNRLFAKAFTESESKNAPEILQKVVRFSSQNQNGDFQGTGDDTGVFYDIDAKLFSESIVDSGTTDSEATNKLIQSGQNFETTVDIKDFVRNSTNDTYAFVTSVDSDTQLTLSKDIMSNGESYQISDGFIQDTRKGTAEDGTANTVTTFPDIAISKVWKPVYEWIGELSQIEFLNTATELSGDDSIVYGRPFLNYVDEVNKWHWFETDNTISSTISIPQSGVYNYKLDKKVFETVNFIIFRGGEDFKGNGTLDFYIDETSSINNRKMRVIAMVDIAKRLIQAEIASGNLISNTSGTFTFGGNRYNRNGTVTPAWTATSYSNDNDYNDSLRTEILRLGKARARNLSKGLANARYKGNIEEKGNIRIVGDLINVSNTNTGQVNELLRIMDIRDNINKNGWFTNLNIEQDQEAIISGDVT